MRRDAAGGATTTSLGLKFLNDGVPTASVSTGESHVIMPQTEVGRRARSKVRARVVGCYSLGWVEVLEGWGAGIEAMAVNSLDHYKDIRQLVSTIPTTAPQLGYDLAPCGSWDGCLAANLLTPEDAALTATLFKRWRPAIVILSIPATISRADTFKLLPVGLPAFYEMKMLTFHHPAVGGVTSATWQFIYYSRWIDVMPSPMLMTGRALPRTLQTALSDIVGLLEDCNFEQRQGVQPPEVIRIVTSSRTGVSSPLFGGDALRPDLHMLPFKEVHFWVRADCIYLKTPIMRRLKTAELFAIWDYDRKLESQQWSYKEQLGVLRGCLACPPAKMLQHFTQFICDGILSRLSISPTLESKPNLSPTVGLTCEVAFRPMEGKATTRVAAAQVDDAEVDLSAWALPGETLEEARTRDVLRHLAV
jgi:hypothetical protein